MPHILELVHDDVRDEKNSVPLVKVTEQTKHTGGKDKTDRRDLHQHVTTVSRAPATFQATS